MELRNNVFYLDEADIEATGGQLPISFTLDEAPEHLVAACGVVGQLEHTIQAQDESGSQLDQRDRVTLFRNHFVASRIAGGIKAVLLGCASSIEDELELVKQSTIIR